MSKRRDVYLRALDFIEDSAQGDFIKWNIEQIEGYVAELEKSLQANSNDIELAERRAWDAARLRDEHMEVYEIQTFEDWKRKTI